jgi:hypothetical protein
MVVVRGNSRAIDAIDIRCPKALCELADDVRQPENAARIFELGTYEHRFRTALAYRWKIDEPVHRGRRTSQRMVAPRVHLQPRWRHEPHVVEMPAELEA